MGSPNVYELSSQLVDSFGFGPEFWTNPDTHYKYTETSWGAVVFSLILTRSRAVTSTDYRCSAPNSVHSLKLHLFCNDFLKYWKIPRVLPQKKIGAAMFKLNMYEKVHLFSTYLSAWVAILQLICSDFAPIFIILLCTHFCFLLSNNPDQEEQWGGMEWKFLYVILKPCAEFQFFTMTWRGGGSAIATCSKSPGRIGLKHPALSCQSFLSTPHVS